jgi:hypothetical protein
MQAHLVDTKHFQPTPQVQSIAVLAWLKQRLDAIRQKQADKQHAAYLRTLDRHFLDDMGVDIAAIGGICPSLNSFVLPMSKAGESKSFFCLPVNMSTR